MRMDRSNRYAHKSDSWYQAQPVSMLMSATAEWLEGNRSAIKVRESVVNRNLRIRQLKA